MIMRLGMAKIVLSNGDDIATSKAPPPWITGYLWGESTWETMWHIDNFVAGIIKNILNASAVGESYQLLGRKIMKCC